METIEDYMIKQASASAKLDAVLGVVSSIGGLQIGKTFGGMKEKFTNTDSSSTLDNIQATELERTLEDVLKRIYKRREERNHDRNKQRTLRF